MTLIQPPQITSFDDHSTHAITVIMQQQHIRLAQLDRPYSARSLTARNYDSAMKALGDYLAKTNTPLPTEHQVQSTSVTC